jgi:hypothetical protein
VDDIGVLRGTPLQTIKLDACERLYDISPLENCADLTAIILPPKAKHVSFLKKLPNLRFIGSNWKEAEMTANAFWGKYGDRYK